MRAQIPAKHTAVPANADEARKQITVGSNVLQPLWKLAKRSDSLIAGSVGEFSAGGWGFQIPRFIFLGQKGGGETIRLGLFATFHGDSSDGAAALAGFLQALEEAPEIAKGFHLYVYPICNPSGFVAGKRDNFNGRDLALEFWCKSSQPEAYYLEREMGVHNFQGVISLHASKNNSEFFATCRSSLLHSALVEPAVESTRPFLSGIQGSQKKHDLVPLSFLTLTDELRNLPFEISFSIPGRIPALARTQGTAEALKSILNSYRTFMAGGANL